MRTIFHSFVVYLVLSTTVVIAAAPVPTEVPSEILGPFFQNYCVDCHQGDNPAGQVQLDDVPWTIASNDTAQRWQDLLDVLNSGDMPPEGENQPKDEEQTAVLRALTKSLLEARRRLTDHGGEIAMRRLNRREYVATIRELFGLKLSIHAVPMDAESESFDTVGADQYFTSSHFDQFFDLAKQIVHHGLDWADEPRAEVRVRRHDPEKKITPKLRKSADEYRERLETVTRGLKQGKSWQQLGFKDEGEMTLFMNRSKKKQNSQRYLEYPRVDEGQYLAPDNSTKRCGFPMRPDPRGQYRMRIHAGVRNGQVPLRHFVKIQDEDVVLVKKVLGTESNPQSIEVMVQKHINQSRLINPVVTALQDQDKKIDPDGDWAAIWIDYLEFEGPLYPEERPFFERLLYPELSERGKPILSWGDQNVERLLFRFAQEAFRGATPSQEYIEHLAALFHANRKKGQKFEAAMEEPLAIVLVSPQFLFLQEAAEPGGGRHHLTDRELAIRLSYFLWSCPPDEELNKLAAQGILSNETVLRGQVDRLLADPKATSFFEGFVGQWADLERFDAITVDPKKFWRFNDGLRQSARREVVEYFKVLVQEDLPAGNLIDSDFVVVDPLLLHHYGLDDGFTAIENKFTKLGLPRESPRGGLLGQMAFLMLGSNGERSSPVIRGAWVMEKLLHDPPPPPPPNVPELGAASRKPVTNREMVVLHQKQTVCSSCHKQMDVIGFGLENFDTIGRWRDTEMVGKKEVPIQPGGTLPSGAAFENIHEMKALLMTQEHRLALELCESLVAYGIGRTIEFSDTDALYAILRENRKDDFRLRSMIAEIVVSPLFRSK